MENNEGFATGMFRGFVSEEEKERKDQKAIMCRAVEAAARRICEAVERTVGDAETLPTPEALFVLSGILYYAAAALQTAEEYSESIPFRPGGCFGV
jgi:hypothetical protein